MTVYGISHTEFFKSVWDVVEAINSHPAFNISYPASHNQQRIIADGFAQKSQAGFKCCTGAVDGILIWIHRPSADDCKEAGCSSGKFFCGRKHKFGLNCQAVCDVRGRFLDISIIFPASTSDCLAFEGSSLFEKLRSGILAPGLCLFGDNAYINALFMATPYSGVSSGYKDGYNFYHSQLRIRIECAFGMLVRRWSILRGQIPMGISIKKTIALVVALAKLHNFCIDEHDEEIPILSSVDKLQTDLRGGIALSQEEQNTILVPRALMDGGNHHEDSGTFGHRNRERQAQRQAASLNQELPRERLFSQVSALNLLCPVPISNAA